MSSDPDGHNATPQSARDKTNSPPRRRGVAPWTLLSISLILVVIPLGLALLRFPMDAHHWADTLASALGLIAFAALLVEFLFSGRQRWISGRIGVARTMRVHRRLAYAVIAIIIIHPFLYSAPDGVSWPWFNAADATLSLNGWSLYSGLGAWILTAAIILTAVDRDRLPWSYETWRILHVVSAIVLGALIAVHAITAGGFSSRLPLAIYWGLLLLAAGFTLIELFLLRPWRQRRHPYIVRTVDKVADRVWTLQVQPEGPDSGQDRMRFRPGQFAWLKFGPRAFRAREHPFSISTSPVDPSTIGFMIKEKGDFTDRIGDILPGSRVYLDGPYGHLLADDQPVPTVYIGAGTGISPILSHLRTFCSDQDPRKLTLVYSVSNDTVIPGKSEIDGMTRLLDLTVHYVVRHPSTRWRGATGTLDRPLLEACIPAQDRDHQRYFVCGPRRMEKRVAVALRQLKIPANRIVTGS